MKQNTVQMNEISDRFHQALDFVIDKGLAQSEAAIARKLGVTASTVNMTKNGERVPTWDMLLRFCDLYPINFWWLRSGEGNMIGNGDRQIALLQKIAQLEAKIAELEKK